MKIHISCLVHDIFFTSGIIDLLRDNNFSLSMTKVFIDSSSEISDPDNPDAYTYDIKESEFMIEQSDLVIGVISDWISTEKGTLKRREWNSILLNRQPSFILVHEEPLNYISHVYASVRRFMLPKYDLSRKDDPEYAEFLRQISDQEFVANFEKFTYIDSLWPS